MKKIFVSAAFFIIATLLWVCFQLEWLLLNTDLSIRPLASNHAKNIEKEAAAPVYLVSYADGHEVFFRNQLALSESVLGRGGDVIMNYNRSMIDPEFIKQNPILNEKVGAGYWLWKPWVILDAMKKAPENAVIIYADTGSVFNGSLKPLVKMMGDHPFLFCYYDDEEREGLLENRVTKEVFQKLGCENEHCYKHPIIWAGFLIVRNNQKARIFIQEWLDHCRDKKLLLGQYGDSKNIRNFKGHQQDQTILGVLVAKTEDKVLIPYYDELTKKYLAWHHRRPGAEGDNPYFLQKSLKPYYALSNRKMHIYEHLFYNNPLVLWLRGKQY